MHEALGTKETRSVGSRSMESKMPKRVDEQTRQDQWQFKQKKRELEMENHDPLDPLGATI